MLNNLRMAGEQCANRTFCASEERKTCANEQRTKNVAEPSFLPYEKAFNVLLFLPEVI